MKNINSKYILSLALILSTHIFANHAFAEKVDSSAKESDKERVNVDSVKEKYWARGDQTELGVVQNRTYTKAKKFELGVFGGFTSSDPFLDIRLVGASFGYHFTEYLGLNIVGWKTLVSPSSALKTFQDTRGATTNTNEPRAFYGAEGSASLIYGKLSLLGSVILHYDFHFLLGGGLTNTESGNYATGILGVGQQLYVGNSVSFRVDYRLMPYHEDIREKVIPTKIGQVVGSRMNWSNTVTLGLTFLFGPSAGGT